MAGQVPICHARGPPSGGGGHFRNRSGDDPRFKTVPARSKSIDVGVCDTDRSHEAANPGEEWLAELRPADILCGKANRLANLFTGRYLADAGYFEAYEHPVEGDVVTPAIPARFQQSPPNVRRRWPKLGEHTRKILTAAGCSQAEIVAIFKG